MANPILPAAQQPAAGNQLNPNEMPIPFFGRTFDKSTVLGAVALVAGIAAIVFFSKENSGSIAIAGKDATSVLIIHK